jgi:hypothetical protein
MAGSAGKVALIAGVTGQDGAYLSEFLLSKGYVVHGVKRRSSSFNTERIDHLIHDPHEQGASFHMHYGDVTDATNIIRIVQETQPDEIYNLAAQSHVQVSFETPDPMDLGRCAYSSQSASSAGKTRPASIKRPPPSCSARPGKARKTRRRRSIRAPLMRPRSFTRTGSR